MDKIILNHVIADIFTGCKDIRSDIWDRDVCFERGGRYLIEARSGTGKSSLCSFLYGLRRDYSGQISFDGEDISKFNTARWGELHRESLSILFQDLRLFPELTALENIEIKNRLTNFQKADTIASWFEALGIPEKMNEPVAKLSYGQQQRVALIRALCQPMDFILLDEPVSHLDEMNSRAMAEILMAEAERQNAGIIVTSIGNRLELDYNQILNL